MKKILLISGAAIVVILAIFIYMGFNKMKSVSPEKNSTYQEGDLKLSVQYNGPFKKGREIFGGLVPYGKVWRTGANEPTTFETNQDLTIQGKKLKKGKYSLWTIPNEKIWTIIFNSEIPFWGIGFNGQTNRDPQLDAVTVDVPVVLQDKEFEQFTISVEKGGEEIELIFLWDKTLVAMPFSK
jgi:hypothetical protein